jgi:hypothetical protein
MSRDIGNYRIIEPLGEGGMGTVYRALDTQLDREVALKLLRPELARRPDIVERFRQEAKIQGRLESANIVRLYQFLAEGNEFFMVMEFVRGSNLRDILRRQGRLTAEQACCIMIQALDGLEYAHRANVIHRDVKPANIMISTDNVIKVADFGIARVLGSARLTRIGNMIGTPEYNSPEAIQGQEATAVSDVYSAGVVLYELIAGSLPFHSKVEYELIKMHVEAPVPPMRNYIENPPKAVEAAIRKALQKRPRDRFQSASELAAALQAALPSLASDAGRPEAGFWGRLKILGGARTPSPSAPAPPSAEGDDERESRRRDILGTLAARIDELLTQHRFDLAERELATGSEHYPGDPLLVELRGRITREHHSYQEGLNLAIQESHGLLRRGLPELAKRALEVSLGRYPDEPALRQLLRRAETELHALEARSSEVQQVAAAVGEFRRQNRFAEAIALIIDAIARMPSQAELAALLSRTVAAQKEHEKWIAVRACAQQVAEFERGGEWARAYASIDALLERYGEEPSLAKLRRNVEAAEAAQLKAAALATLHTRLAERRAAGDLDGAEQLILELLGRYSDDPKLLELLAGVRQAKETARQHAVAEFALARARGLAEDREWARAIAALDTAIADAPAETRLARARSKYEAARREHESAVEARAARLRALLATSRFDDAIADARAAARDFPKAPVFDSLLREARLQAEAARRESSIRATLDSAEGHIQAAEFAQAERELSAALAEHLNEPRLAARLAEATRGRMEQEKREAIAACLRDATRLAAAGQLEAALDGLDTGLAVYSDDAGLRQARARVAAQLAAEQRARSVALTRSECETAAAAGQFDAALATLAAALRAWPGDTELAALEQRLLDLKRDTERRAAEQECARATAALVGRGDYEAAGALCRRQLELYPESEALASRARQLEAEWSELSRQRRIATLLAEAGALLEKDAAEAALALLDGGLTEHGEQKDLVRLRAAALARLRDQQCRDALADADQALQRLDWERAEAAAAALELRWGTSSAVVTIRKKLGAARRRRQATYDKAASRMAARLRAGQPAEVLALVEALAPTPDERLALEPLLQQARQSILEIEQAGRLDELCASTTRQIEAGELEPAAALLAAARAEFGVEPRYQALEARLKRLGAIASAQREAAECAARLAWDDALRRLKEARAEFGDDPGLVALAERIATLRADRDTAQAALDAARRAFDAEQHHDAISLLEQVVTTAGSKPELAPLLAEALHRLPIYQHAERLHAAETAAQAEIEQAHFEAAERLLEAALPDMPGERSILRLLDEARRRRSRAQAAEACAAGVRAQLDEGNLGKAESILLDGLREHPDSAALRELRPLIDRELLRLRREQAIRAVLASARASLAAGCFAEARRKLAAARLEHGEDSGIDALNAELDQAEGHAKAVDLALAAARARVAQARLSEAIEAILALPEAVRSDARLATLLSDCQRRVRARARRLEQVRLRSSQLLEVRRFDDAVALIEEFVRDFGSDESLAPTLVAASEGRAVETQLVEARRLLAAGGPKPALELLGPLTTVYPANADLAAAAEMLRQLIGKEERRKAIDQLRARLVDALGRHDWSVAARERDLAQTLYPGELLLSDVDTLINNARAEAELAERQARITALIDARDFEAALQAVAAGRAAFPRADCWPRWQDTIERRRNYVEKLAEAAAAAARNDLALAAALVRPLVAGAPDDQAARLLEEVSTRQRAELERDRLNREQLIGEALAEASRRLAQGDPQSAVSGLESASTLYPGSFEIRNALDAARAALDQQAREAQAAERRRLEIESIEAEREQARRLAHDSDFERALAILVRLEQRLPDDAAIAAERLDAERALNQQRREAEQRARAVLASRKTRLAATGEEPIPEQTPPVSPAEDAEMRARQALASFASKRSTNPPAAPTSLVSTTPPTGEAPPAAPGQRKSSPGKLLRGLRQRLKPR